jgi:hypothetical protein
MIARSTAFAVKPAFGARRHAACDLDRSVRPSRSGDRVTNAPLRCSDKMLVVNRLSRNG